MGVQLGIWLQPFLMLDAVVIADSEVKITEIFDQDLGIFEILCSKWLGMQVYMLESNAVHMIIIT